MTSVQGNTAALPPAGPSDRASRGLRRLRVIYAVSTSLVYAVMLFSVVSFTFHDRFPFPNGNEGAFEHLGLPGYFKVELTIAKALGLLVLANARVHRKIREFAYFGFAITLVSASVAHLARGDGRLNVLYVIDPLVFLGALVVSYVCFLRLAGPSGRPTLCAGEQRGCHVTFRSPTPSCPVPPLKTGSNA